jgi:DNA-binding PadR family transcriptional regulator
VAEAEEEVHGERRRYYELTGAGRRRLQSEVAALKQVLAHARVRFITG